MVSLLLLSTGGELSARAEGLTVLVTDAAHQPLPGVTVKYADTGHVTDLNGIISIPDALAPNVVVTFSYIGFETEQMTVERLKAMAPKVIVLREQPEQLHDLVVTARLNKVRRASVGQSLGSSVLREQIGADLGEALQGIRGVSIIGNGASAGKPVIHGMHGHRILLLDNGVRYSGQLWGHSHAPEMDLSQVGRISVLKGAESVRYGADALGGVILTEDAVLPYQGERLAGSTAVYGTSNGLGYGTSATLEGSFGKQRSWAWRLRGAYSNSGDKRSAKYLLNNTGHRQYNLQGAVGKRSDRAELQLLVNHFGEKEGVFFGAQMGNIDLLKERIEAGRPDPEVLTPYTRYIDYGYHTVGHTLSKLQGHYHINREQTVSGHLAYQRDRRREYHLRRNKLSHIPEVDLVMHNLQAEVLWQYNPTSPWEVQSGLSGSYTNNYNRPGTGVVPMIPNYIEAGGGLFVMGKYSTDQWGAEAGIRTDGNYLSATGIDYDSRAYGGTQRQFNITYSLGLYRRLGRGVTLRTQLGTAWRAPHVAELYSNGIDQESGIYIVGSDPMKSERALKWIASLNYTNDMVRLDIEGYLQWLDHYIFQEPTGEYHRLVSGVYPLFRYRQTSATLHGADAEVTVTPLPRLSYSLSTGMLWAAESSTGRYLPYIPPFHIKQELKKRFDLLQGGYVALEHKYTAEQKRFDPETDLIPFAPPAYHLVGLRAGLTQALRHGEVTYTLSVENLFNKEYKEYTNLARYYAHDLGRNIKMMISYQF